MIKVDFTKAFVKEQKIHFLRRYYLHQWTDPPALPRYYKDFMTSFLDSRSRRLLLSWEVWTSSQSRSCSRSPRPVLRLKGLLRLEATLTQLLTSLSNSLCLSNLRYLRQTPEFSLLTHQSQVGVLCEPLPSPSPLQPPTTSELFRKYASLPALHQPSSVPESPSNNLYDSMIILWWRSLGDKCPELLWRVSLMVCQSSLLKESELRLRIWSVTEHYILLNIEMWCQDLMERWWWTPYLEWRELTTLCSVSSYFQIITNSNIS